MRRSVIALSLLLVVPMEANAWGWGWSRYVSPSYYFNRQAYQATQLQSLVTSAKQGATLFSVIQQARMQGLPMDGLLTGLMQAGVVTAANSDQAIQYAVRAAPASAAAIVTAALASKLEVTRVVAVARLAAPDQYGAILVAAIKARPAEARTIVATAYAEHRDPESASIITSAALAGGMSQQVLDSISKPTPSLPVVSSANSMTNAASGSGYRASTSLISTPSAGGGGSSSASPN